MKRINVTRLSIKNLQRKIIRSILLLLAVAMVTGTLFGATIFMSGMQNALRIGTYRLGADILVVPEQYEAQARSALLAGEPTSFYMDRKDLRRGPQGRWGQKGFAAIVYQAVLLYLLL